MNTWKALAAGLTVAALSLGGASIASAVDRPVEPPPAAQRGEPISPANSYLATPEELSHLAGYTAKDLELQQQAIDALTPKEALRQSQLRAAQEALFPNADELPIIDETANRVVYPNSCLDQPNAYKLTYTGRLQNGYYTSCYIGVGTYDLSTNPIRHAYSVRAGNETGRVLYKIDTATYSYWSTWRGPNNFNTYYFEEGYGLPDVFSIQLQ